MSQKEFLRQLPTMLTSVRSTMHAFVRADQAGEEDRLPAFTIALSREAGIDCSAIAHELGKRLDWPVYDHELLERIADDMHLRADQLKRVDECSVSWLAERLETFLARPVVTEPAYVEHLIATLLSLASHGRCVVVGRGSAHLLPPRTTLRVRLVAPREDRIAAIAKAEKIGKEEAARRLEHIDRERAAFIRYHFRHDPADPHHYDLVLNTGGFSTGECADVIVSTLTILGERKKKSSIKCPVA